MEKLRNIFKALLQNDIKYAQYVYIKLLKELPSLTSTINYSFDVIFEDILS